MTAYAIAARVRIYQNTETKAQWQNFWMDKTVAGYAPKRFNTSAIFLNRTADEGGITLSMPALADDIGFILAAIEGEYLADVQLYEQRISEFLPNEFSDMTLIGRFVGEIQTMQMNVTSMSVEIGAAIDAVNGEIPGRRITTSLVGRLPAL